MFHEIWGVLGIRAWGPAEGLLDSCSVASKELSAQGRTSRVPRGMALWFIDIKM